MPLWIDFVTPEQFGFSPKAMENGNIATIVCGHVSTFCGWIPHTEMAHIFRQTEEGLFMCSRFWLGKTMSPSLRKFVMKQKMARGMAEHCCIEYRNLAEILQQGVRVDLEFVSNCDQSIQTGQANAALDRADVLERHINLLSKFCLR